MHGSLGTPRYKKFTSLLIEARIQVGLTQQAVSDQLDKPQSFVAKYERGERRLDFIELIDIAAILKIEIGDLVTRILDD
ncbi:MAG: transcriptional regulator [Blastopirellula sp.]|nr:MAG: transcriptional regulator [Blastopirellula sp.]